MLNGKNIWIAKEIYIKYYYYEYDYYPLQAIYIHIYALAHTHTYPLYCKNNAVLEKIQLSNTSCFHNE